MDSVTKPFLTAIVVGFIAFSALGHFGSFWHRLLAVDGPKVVANRVHVDEGPLDNVVLDRIATLIVRRAVTVECNPGPAQVDAWGYAPVDGSVETLATDVCRDLAHFAHLTEPDWRCIEADTGICGGAVTQTIVSLHVIAHEAWHLRGLSDEAKTDCYSFQYIPEVAQLLGASGNRAFAVVSYYRDHYVAMRRPPENYVSPDCHAGTPLDLNPDTPAWPT
jgi:hypothetical protein